MDKRVWYAIAVAVVVILLVWLFWPGDTATTTPAETPAAPAQAQ